MYVTNVPSERLSPADVAQGFRLHWQVGTYYKTGTSSFGLGELPSRKPHIVRTLIEAALIRAGIAMQAKRQAERRRPAKPWLNPTQWVQVWRVAVEAVFHAILAGITLTPARQPASESLATLARDPKVTRPPTRSRSPQEMRMQHGGIC
jgi:hypothetical protein